MDNNPSELINFIVNHESFTLTKQQLDSFPLQDAYLNVVYRNWKTGQMQVKTTVKGDMIITAVNEEGTAFTNFALVARLYQDPTLSLFELLQVDTFLRLVETIKSHYHPHQKQLSHNLIIPQYDNLSDSHQKEIQNHPCYKSLQRDNYRSLREEFKFYGIDDLPNLNPGSKHESINPSELIDRFESDFFGAGCGVSTTLKCYKTTFSGGCHLQEDSTTEACRNFLETLRGMSGVISGSSVLRSVLQEDWLFTDLDVYVTEENLQAFLLKNSLRFEYRNSLLPHQKPDRVCYLSEYIGNSATSIVHRHLNDLLHKSNSGETPYLLSLYKALKANGKKDNEIEAEILEMVRHEMKNSIVQLLGGKDAKIIMKKDTVNNYHELNGISYVIRFTFRNLEVDLIVTRCSIPFVIDKFDFGFNKVYYDGYSVNCLDWEALSTKVCTNDYCVDLNDHSPIERYCYNIARIRKYFRRGYLVLL